MHVCVYVQYSHSFVAILQGLVVFRIVSTHILLRICDQTENINLFKAAHVMYIFDFVLCTHCRNLYIEIMWYNING